MAASAGKTTSPAQSVRLLVKLNTLLVTLPALLDKLQALQVKLPALQDQTAAAIIDNLLYYIIAIETKIY